MLSGTRANIAVKVIDDDLLTLRRLGENVRDAMQTIPGVADLSLEQQMDIPVVRFVLNRTAIARYGLKAGDVAEAIETSFAGTSVWRVFDRATSFDLVVKLDTEASVDFDRMADRDFLQRGRARPCGCGERHPQSRVAGCADVGRLPRGVRRQLESQQSASERLLVLGASVVVGLLVVLVLAFENCRDALLIMLNLPLALIGGVVGVFLSGGVLSVASMIGFITLFGIATRNGIMLVSRIRHLMAFEGVKDFREAVERRRMSGSRRF